MIGDLGLDQGNRVALFPLGQLQPLVQLLVKIAITHLLEDVGVPCFVDLEGFAAVWADDFMHGNGTSSFWLDGDLSEHAGQFFLGASDR
jgi:hypothetical protein